MTNVSRISFAGRLGLALVAALFCATAHGAEPNAVTITTTKLDLTDKTLEWCYRITNGSDGDIWLCERANIMGKYFEVYFAEETRTLVVRRRLDVPIEGLRREQPIGRYVRLRAGRDRVETLVMPLPICPWSVFRASRTTQDIRYAEHLAIEVGFFPDDLPEVILSVLDKAEKVSDDPGPDSRDGVLQWFGGSVSFITYNENEPYRSERALVPWTNQKLPGEHILRLQLDDVHVPYTGHRPDYTRPPFDLRACNRLEISYQPSMLDYFFPFPTQRDLLDLKELEYLKLQRTFIIDDPSQLGAVANEGARCYPGGLATTGSAIRLICSGPHELLSSLTVYDGSVIETADRQWFTFPKGLPSLSRHRPEIIPFELRMRCAGHLSDLWWRLRLYSKVLTQESESLSKGIEVVYPPFVRWCDETIQAYRDALTEKQNVQVYRCPGADEGKCHYAMNPNCEPNSPVEMVLLFETKAGWNQHGGAELFTFDNHGPKGGCVLLNDGTIKFIRTEAELHVLRWE